jgi:curved DNA-binding protein
VEYKDYYQALGVDKGASADDIKKAYRKLVRKYHPDVSKAKDADAKTKEINEAYGVLGDPEKRAAYDELGSGRQPGQEFRPPPDWASSYGGADMDSDFFSDLFAHVGRRSRAGGHGGYQMRGEDIHASIGIDLADAYHGATRTVTMRTPQRDASGRTVTADKQLSVNIPKGVLPGQQLRLAGQGHPGIGGGPPGDLFLELSLNPDARYRVEGSNVYETVPVAPWEAALGAHINVPTPSGEVEVKVPVNSQTGRKLRLKARGIPANPPGDLYLVLEVALPPADTDQARQLYETMAREFASFNPRAKIGG